MKSHSVTCTGSPIDFNVIFKGTVLYSKFGHNNYHLA